MGVEEGGRCGGTGSDATCRYGLHMLEGRQRQMGVEEGGNLGGGGQGEVMQSAAMHSRSCKGDG